jgi:hypothetical protein
MFLHRPWMEKIGLHTADEAFIGKRIVNMVLKKMESI